MANKSLLHRLFGLGKLPKKFKGALEAEGIVLIDEGIGGSLIKRNFRTPGRYHSYRREGFAGSLVLTEKRFAAFAFWRPVINVPLDHPSFGELEILVPRIDLLTVGFDVAKFHDNWSGSVECRFKTPLAVSFKDRL